MVGLHGRIRRLGCLERFQLAGQPGQLIFQLIELHLLLRVALGKLRIHQIAQRIEIGLLASMRMARLLLER